MTGFSESSTVQQAIVDRLSSEHTWVYVPGGELDRPLDGVLVQGDVIDALVRLNPLIAEDPDRVDEVLPRIRAAILSADGEGLVAANEVLTTWLRGQQTFHFSGTPSEQHDPVRLIDFEDLSNNTFMVSDEVRFGSPGNQSRFDIVLWVNGFPLVVVETKTPVDSGVSWLNAANDIHNAYEVEHAPFFAPNLLSVATEGRELHYGGVRQPATDWLPWGSTLWNLSLEGWPKVKKCVDSLLDPAVVLRILQSYVLFDRPVVDGTPRQIKLTARYPQVEAVEAIRERVLSDRKRGLVWHHQGTGKTLLQGFAALRLLNDDAVGGPTVLLVMDRIDLVEDVLRQFRTAGLPRMTEAKSKRELRQLLKDDGRGIIVTTIFRFEGADELNARDNVIVLVDEAHRTQEGTLGHDMRTALPNAQWFGLTGTPVTAKDRNTFRLFGDEDDPGWVLNHYSIERSIQDGSSVPIHVEAAPVEYQLAGDALEEAFEALADEENLTDEERDVLASKAAKAKTIYSAPEMVEKMVAHMVDHFYAKVDPLGLKAQIVALDREVCVLYEQELARQLDARDSTDEAAVVMTVSTSKDEPKEWKAKYDLDRSEEEKVRNRFRDHSDPLKFLIVTAKLLTGFDASNEGAMYLARPLKLHTLFQAICRTNRRWTNPVTKQEKRFGLIVDYTGLGDEIAKALRDADPETGGMRPVDVTGLLEELEAALDGLLARFDGIDRSDVGYETLVAAQERIPKGTVRDEFARDFLTAQAMWEFLYPNPVLKPYTDDYKWLAKVYESVKPTKVSDALLWQRLGAKTLELVHGHISDVKVTGTGLDEVVVDEGAIEAIRQLSLPGTAGAHAETLTVGEALDTIAERLRRRMQANEHSVYKRLSERLEQLRRSQLDKASASAEFLRDLLELAQQVTAAEKAEDEGNLDELDSLLPDPHIGALTQIFEEYAPPETPGAIEDIVKDIDEIVRQTRFSGWNETQTGDRVVRKEVRLVLKNRGLPTTGELFDRAYAYIRENY
ncbi:MAG: HsdR family type I site-specific deoxyribonuclease [Microthrixaceae bacterium]